jgi:hypothetical protein
MKKTKVCVLTIMIEVNPSRFKLLPWAHQLRGVKLLIKHPVFALWWKMRLGKTKCIIDTACLLFDAGDIDTVLIVGPKQVVDIWTEKVLGEIKTHDWSGAKTYEYKKFDGLFLPHGAPCYVSASVEFLRQQGPRGDFPFVNNLLAALAGRCVWFVFDESAVLSNHKSLNTKAMLELRKGVQRVTLLNGTPRGNSHLSFYSQFKLLDPAILACKVFEQFRARYSELVKVPHKWVVDPVTKERRAVATHMEVVAEKNMDDFTRRTAPYCDYREQDVLDMPKKVPGILTVAMSPKCWKAYCDMRDEMVAEIESGVCAVGQAAVKSMRLAQLCAGFLGGVAEYTQTGFEGMSTEFTASTPITVEVADEPTEMLMGWLKLKIAEDENFKAVVWSRFVPEIIRLSTRLIRANIPHGVKFSGEDSYNNELHPRHKHKGPYVLVCQPQTAQYGNNFSRARTSIFLSQDYNRITRAQAAERVQADGVGATTAELDVVVTGPRGQKTIVHDIIASVREKEDAEKRTAQDWKRILTAE